MIWICCLCISRDNFLSVTVKGVVPITVLQLCFMREVKPQTASSKIEYALDPVVFNCILYV